MLSNNSQKRILFLLGNYWKQCQGGAELQTYYLFNEAIKQGLNVNYCFISNGKEFLDKYKDRLIPIHKKAVWSKLGNVKFPYFFKIFRILNKLNPEIIYNRGATGLTGIVVYWAKKNNRKVIFHVASNQDIKHRKFHINPYLFIENLFIMYGLKKADTIICQTELQKRMIIKNIGRVPDHVIPNGHPVPSEECCSKSKNQIIVLWIANWKPVKQPHIFVELAKKLRFLPNVCFIMVGRNENYKALIKEARKTKIGVLGEIPIEDVENLLCKAHILVNTSTIEGFSNTFIQAWLRRVPVVSLYVDPDNLIKRYKLGFHSGNFEQLCANTKKLVEDFRLREFMGSNARRYAIENFSLKNIKKILEIISEGKR